MKLEVTYKQITAIIILVAFFAQTFSKNLVIADYYTNVAEYARNCENKARPKMNCNGKCQMMKKLQEEEKKEQKNPERKAENKNEVALSSESFFCSCKPAYKVAFTKKSYPHNTDYYSFNCTKQVFHPPKV